MTYLVGKGQNLGRRIEGESLQDEGILGTYGYDELNHNGKLLLSFATDNKLAITNTFFSTRKGGVSHTYNGVTGSGTRVQTYRLSIHVAGIPR